MPERLCRRCRQLLTPIYPGQTEHPLCSPTSTGWIPRRPHTGRQDELPTSVTDRQAELHNAAQWCAARGWAVFPVRPGDKRPAFPDHDAPHCTGTDSRCRSGHTGWEARATTDPGRIGEGWAHTPYNIGIATGPSGLIVIDLDKPKPGEIPPPEWALPGITDGADILAALCDRHGQPWPGDTFTVRTGRGGWHLYFTAPPGVRLGNTSGRSQRGLGWLIDTRGRGGYVVAPASSVRLLDSTGLYELVDGRSPAPLPGWIAALLDPASHHPPRVECPPPPATVAAVSSYAHAAIAREAERVRSSPDHGHNWALNKAAFNLGRRIAAGILDRELAETALQAAGEEAHTNETPTRIAAVIRAGIDAGIRKATHTAARKPLAHTTPPRSTMRGRSPSASAAVYINAAPPSSPSHMTAANAPSPSSPTTSADSSNGPAYRASRSPSA